MPTALVTGASAGIGATFARQLADRGYDLILVARRADRLEQLARELGRARVLAADLTRDDDLARVEEACASIDLLVNNAGFGSRGRFFEDRVERQADMHRLHVLATVRLTHAALRGMVARRRGAVINVSSVSGFMQGAQSVSYCATKCWMNSFTEGLSMELENTGVTVQALCPGFTFTEFHDVIGMDRAGIARSLWMTADFVVQESLRGLDRGALYVIPGWRYKLIAFLLRRLPAVLMRALSRRSGRYRRPNTTP